MRGIAILVVSLWLSTSVSAADRTLSDRPPPPPPAIRLGTVIFSPADLMRHVEYLASPEFEGRTGRGAQQAADYLARQFRETGLQPLFAEEFVQPIPDSTQTEGSGAILGRNVGAILRGSDPLLRDEVILLGVHYDHLGVRGGKIYPGADDNASSIAMMLETARYVRQLPQPPRRSIAFVGFDLEEQLLWGSRWFVAHPPVPLERIKLMVTADLIGRSLGDLPLPMVFMFGSEYCPQLRDQISQVGVPPGLELGRLSTDFIGTRSDYGPFRDQRVPFLFFSTGEHPDYHSPRDRPEKIDSAKLSRIASLIAQTVVTVADAQEPPRWNSRPLPDLEEAATMERITSLLLDDAAAGRRTLSPTVRFVAEQTSSKTRYLRQRGSLSEDERSLLRRSAQFLLLSAF